MMLILRPKSWFSMAGLGGDGKVGFSMARLGGSEKLVLHVNGYNSTPRLPKNKCVNNT
jgi:hypothetical protein